MESGEAAFEVCGLEGFVEFCGLDGAGDSDVRRRTADAASRMAILIATASRVEALGPDRAKKVRAILRDRVAEERNRARALLEAEARLAFG